MKKIMILSLIVSIFGCSNEEWTYQYIKTDLGYVSFQSANCKLGLLFNNDFDNMLDKDSNPIRCEGYVYLNKRQIKELKDQGAVF